MKIIRAVPETIPPYRNYVVDQIDQVPLWDYDMKVLADLDDDIILLEWDIVVAHHDLHNFVSHAQMSPDRVQVAPYVLYPTSTGLNGPVWAHRIVQNDVPLALRWVETGETYCDLFSTGLVYLPRNIIEECAHDDEHISWQPNLTDSKLAFWHHHKVGRQVIIHWDVRPIHLHYDVSDVYNRSGVDHVG